MQVNIIRAYYICILIIFLNNKCDNEIKLSFLQTCNQSNIVLSYKIMIYFHIAGKQIKRFHKRTSVEALTLFGWIMFNVLERKNIYQNVGMQFGGKKIVVIMKMLVYSVVSIITQ